MAERAQVQVQVPVRIPKLPLRPDERLALRRAQVRTIELAQRPPREVAAATEGAIPLARARQLCSLARFQQLPSVGPATAQDLVSLGYSGPEDLVGEDAERMLKRLERKAGRQDPCVGDVFHCAVWHAEHPGEAPERGWWEWSRERLARASSAPARPPRR